MIEYGCINYDFNSLLTRLHCLELVGSCVHVYRLSNTAHMHNGSVDTPVVFISILHVEIFKLNLKTKRYCAKRHL